MKLFLILVVAALVGGCVSVEPQYRAVPETHFASSGSVIPISSIEFLDTAGGLKQDGVALVLKRPLIDTVGDAVKKKLQADNVPVGISGGGHVSVVMTRASIKRGPGMMSNITSSINFAIRVSSSGTAVCERDASGGATVHEGFFSSPVVETLSRALTDAVDHVALVLQSSCASTDDHAVSPSSGPAVAVIVGVERHRDGLWPENFAADDAREFARDIKTGWGVRDDRIALMIDSEATLADLNKRLERWLPEHVVPGGRVAVFFSGQGIRDAKGVPFLVPFDGDRAYPRETSYSLQRLLDVLGRLPANVTVTISASFSGASGSTRSIEKDLTIPGNVIFNADWHSRKRSAR